MSDLTRLADHVDMVVGFPFRSSEYTTNDSGVRLLRGDNIGQGVVRWANAKHWPDGSPVNERYSLRRGDVVVAMDRPWIEAGLKFAQIRQSDIPSLLVQRVARLRVRQGLDQDFLALLIGSGAFSQYVRREETGTAVPHISGQQILNFRFARPSLERQKAITKVISALDDKIAANERIAQLSDDLAQASGSEVLRTGAGTEDSLGPYVEFVKGVSYKSEDIGRGSKHLVTLKCFGRDGRFHAHGLKQYAGTAKESQQVRATDVLIAQTDLTQRAEVIGRALRVPASYAPYDLVASLDVCIVRPLNRLTFEVLLIMLQDVTFRDHALRHTNGTTVLHLASRAVPAFRTRIPDAETSRRVSEIVRPLFQRADHARREVATVRDVRETLLPRLMSGELRIRDAERVVSDAV